MALDLVALLKLKVMAGGCNSHCRLHATLLIFFLLKLPLAARLRGSFSDMASSLRLLFFQLHQVLFASTSSFNGRRLERVIRLFRERVADSGRAASVRNSTEESLHAFSMLSL